MDKETYRIMWNAWEARIKVKTRAHNPEDRALLENVLGLDVTLEEIVKNFESKLPLPVGYDDLGVSKRREKIRKRAGW